MVVLFLAGLLATILVHPGHAKTFAHAQAGDSVVCVGNGSTIRAHVPAFGLRNRYVWNRRLGLTIKWRDSGGVVVTCRRR